VSLDTTSLAIQLLLIVASVLLVTARTRRWSAAPDLPADATNSRAIVARDVLILTAGFGLATGLLHILLAAINRYVRGRLIFSGPAMLWMTPLAYVLIFSAVGSVLAIAAIIGARSRLRSLAIGLSAWLGVFGLLVPFVQLHRVAAFALAAGVAVQVNRQMSRQPIRWVAAFRRGLVAVATVLVIVASGSYLWQQFVERQQVRSLPPARSGTPSVLLIVLDTVRAANLSLYGYDRDTTPQLSRMAHDAVTFDWAFSTAPWTLKSHMTMFTGQYPSESAGDFLRPVQTDLPMLAELFRSRGYVTGGFVANLLYTARESGLGRGFIHYDDYRVSLRQVPFHSWIPHMLRFPGTRNVFQALLTPGPRADQRAFHNRTYERKSASTIATSFLEWQSRLEGRPFFAFLNFFDAHQPYQSPPGLVRQFAGPDRLMSRYDAAIAYIDSEIGRAVNELERRGVLENIVVIVTSDHGEQFGEHGLFDHGNSLYLPLLHVPLTIRFPPRAAKGHRVTSAVTLRDLAATIIDLAGVKPDGEWPGRSLAAQWSGGGSARSESRILAQIDNVIRPEPNLPVRFGPMVSVFDDQLHYIRRGDGLEELFDYRADTAERTNLAASPERAADLSRLRALTASHNDLATADRRAALQRRPPVH
jgi:arylsulfatase A-like enzyme